MIHVIQPAYNSINLPHFLHHFCTPLLNAQEQFLVEHHWDEVLATPENFLLVDANLVYSSAVTDSLPEQQTTTTIVEEETSYITLTCKITVNTDMVDR